MDVAAVEGMSLPGIRHRNRATQVMPNQKRVKARRKRRKELLLIQICVFGGLLLLVKGVSFLAENSGFDVSVSSIEDQERRVGRKLLQEMDNTSLENVEFEEESKNCTAPALHEFPTDLFTNKERTEGAVALHVLCTIYMFCALALVCDDYFVPSLEKICERLQLSEDVAGATFMAAGSSAPELFTSVIGVFITKGDVGVGTIVGSAVFNILCIIGVCGFFAGQAVKLSHWALLRDSIYYTFSIIALIAFIYDEKVSWWESLVLILMYAVYILIMKFNGRAHRYFDRRKKNSVNLANGLTGSTDLEDNISCDATAVLLKKANFHCKPSVLMVDELLSAYPHQLSFSEAGMRIMITSHFSPRTRLTMASRMLINERQRLINTTETRVNRMTNGDSDSAGRAQGRCGLENGLGRAEHGLNGRCKLHRLESGNETETENEDNENNENDEEGEDEDDKGGPLVPFKVPAGACNKLKWFFMWPLSLLLFFTIPNCSKRRWERWFMVSFFTATIWIAGLSYIMVWMVTVIGFTLGIPDVIMGITFLAAGTSVPDCMASVIVARQGMGDMAISNSIGSNVFDILVGLGLPWALQTLCIDYGSNIHLNSRGLIFSVGLLLASVFFTVVGVHLNKWTLDRRLGLICLIMYAIFLCFSILIEFNVFIFVNLPMCRDIH
ncbi:sodium/potassium/calcium exchanger 3-like isoform X1 [Melanotaenia boesemani]|uniref:sodium/potassium/calcium exchanger 3-like isoform X1 n=1 Tax=Melanotaenia boesemani TaxID=1250792 RepID=UPI001C0561FD|nr:sodium/potassium/calcium exchanger 3-like isoform X1 [Melanotaenia boesemani]XP_041838723.1 sodium/potassium/calcium exchanger 3-like isoform X1 [Melanotaenia boesemani]